MKPRNTVMLVIIAHIGLFLIWMCMGGCSLNRGQNAVDDISSKDVKIPGPEAEEVVVNTTEAAKEPVFREPIDTENTNRAEQPTAYDKETEIKYVVKSGDTLTKISREFGVTIKQIQDRNDIQDPKTLREGRELYIPKKDGTAVEKEEPVVEKSIDSETKTKSGTETTATETASGMTKVETEKTITDTTTESATGTEKKEETTGQTGTDETQYTTHEVVAGDTVWKLARTYGVTTDDILKANNITDPKKIQVGQKLLIPKK